MGRHLSSDFEHHAHRGWQKLLKNIYTNKIEKAFGHKDCVKKWHKSLFFLMIAHRGGRSSKKMEGQILPIMCQLLKTSGTGKGKFRKN